jgi:hypothetical protein
LASAQAGGRCFLTGAPETLQMIYDRMSQGLSYQDAAAAEPVA